MHAEMVLGAGAFRTVSLAIDSRDGINAMQPEWAVTGGTLLYSRHNTHTGHPTSYLSEPYKRNAIITLI